MKTHYFIYLLVVLSHNFFAQSNTLITGLVTKEDNTVIEGAVIILKSNENEYRSETGSDGKYYIQNVLPGKYELSAENIGYKVETVKKINIMRGDTLTYNLKLKELIYTTEEIDVISDRFRQSQDDMRTSLLHLSPKTTKVIPGVGEDVLRSLQTLPGVSSPNDFSSQMVIRGSGPDQNLIIMDDVEIFNPYRLYGVFSMFNPETLDEVNLITGGFPSKYGDRLSAVLDVSNKEGSKSKYFTGLTNINIANANIVINGKLPLKSINGSWLVSTRRSYYDLILGPFAKSAGLIDESASFPSFQDVQGKISLDIFKDQKIILNGIYSTEAVNIIPGNSKEFEDSISVKDDTRNDVLSLSWLFAPNIKFLTKTTLSWYRNSGDAQFGGELLDPVLNREIYDPEIRDSLKALGLFLGISFSSKYTFRKYSFNNSTIFNSDIHRTEIGGGIDILKTDLEFQTEFDERLRAIIQGNPNFSAIDNSFLEGKNYFRANLFAQDRVKLSNKLFVQAGLRFDYFDIIQKAYLAPRFNLSYAVDKVTTIRAGTGYYYQSPGYEKLIDGQAFYDLTPDKAERLDAERSIHYILGLERWFSDELFARFETYYKDFSDLIVQEKLTGYRYIFTPADPSNQDPNYLRNPANWVRSSSKQPYDSLTSTPVNGASGSAYGMEIFLEKKAVNPSAKLSGWISYSLSWANRNRSGIIAPFRFDQRHSLNIVVNYRMLPWLEFGTRFNYSSNFPITKPVGIKPRVVGDSLAVLPVLNTVQFDFDYGSLSNYNSQKKPDYHRLDIRATAYTRIWDLDWAFYIDVINVYNKQNVIAYDYYVDSNLKVKEKIVGQFPILPTIGINVRF